MVSPGNIDLNQLALLHHLMLERSVSRVADKLGLTQPAVSNALAKLRRQLGDGLFVRTPAGMAPTPFAEHLAQQVGTALALIHGGLNQQRGFDAANAQRAITIGMTDIGEIVFLPRLLERLRLEAPGVVLNTVRHTAVNLRDDMAAGKVDLAIGLLPELKAGFYQRLLFPQRYVCLFRQGHAIDRKAVSLAAYQAAEHLVVVAAGTGHGSIDQQLRRAGVQRQVRLSVPHFVSVGHILQATDLVATVPERLAQQLAGPFQLAYRAPPVKLPAVPIKTFWHAQAHGSPDNQWLRALVFELFAQDQGSLSA